jgi:predicted lipid-binding transport protein (Tim44 family)
MKKPLLLRNQNLISLLITLILVSSFSMELYARAGGGGGGGSGGGDGGGLIGLLIYLLLAIPFPWNLIVIGIIIVVAILVKKKAKQQTILNKLPSGSAADNAKVLENYMKVNPTFNADNFKVKVKTAFIGIQDSWMKKDMAKVRKYISDGMYQRLNIQFKMMNILDQTNTIDKLIVHNVYIDKIEYDGNYEIIHTAIHASIVDKFVSKKYPQLNSGGAEDFVEYWTFIKKKGIQEKNLFNSQNCPNCGAELPQNAGDVSQCSFCKTITNLGDYDWILCEITQADDYISQYPRASKNASLATTINEIMKSDPTFSIQHLEDKASNGYLQMVTARVLKDPKIMRRFVTDEAFEKFSKFDYDDIVYNRFYLNDVTLIGISLTDKKYTISFSIKYSYQSVSMHGDKAVLMNPVVMSKTETLLMSRDATPTTSKGSLYAHVCPSCGGPVKDTIDIKCQFCGNELNSTKNEWIISDVLDLSSYQNYVSSNKDDIIAGLNTDKLENLYDVRDYAFNNVLVVMAADGKFENEELTMATSLAKKWGYKQERIMPMFDMAKSGSLVVRMPNDNKKQQKIFRLMEKAAAIDGMVSDEEKTLLDNVKQQYKIDTA